MNNPAAVAEDPTKVGGLRWFYLVLAVLLMCMISGVQYSWTLYANPVKDLLGVSLAAVQTSFTLSQVIQAGSQPGGGYFVDKFGPKVPLIVAGIMVGSSIFVGLMMVPRLVGVVVDATATSGRATAYPVAAPQREEISSHVT